MHLKKQNQKNVRLQDQVVPREQDRPRPIPVAGEVDPGELDGSYGADSRDGGSRGCAHPQGALQRAPLGPQHPTAGELPGVSPVRANNYS